MNRRAEVAMEKRSDISKVMVHLTRDDRNDRTEEEGGASARDNFVSILDGKTICALGIYCQHRHGLLQLPKPKRRNFEVACFTSTPLNEIKNLLDVGPRNVNLEAFGFVFKREFLYAKGAQAAFYVNAYGPNPVIGALDHVYQMGKQNRFTGKTWPLLPFTNVINERNDFIWENEWRVLGDVEFEMEDLVCVVLPEDEYELRERMVRAGVAAIDPAWGYDRMVIEMAGQQRDTKKHWKAKVPKGKIPKGRPAR